MTEILPCILLPLVFAVICFIVWLSFASERAFWREWEQRERLNDEAFYQMYYANSDVPADIPKRLRPIYGDYFGIDPAKLRPHDIPPGFGEMCTADLVQQVESEFDITISDSDTEQMDGSLHSIICFLRTACETNDRI